MDQDIRFRNEFIGFLLFVLLFVGVILLVAGIAIANALLAVLGLSFIFGFVVLTAWYVKMIGGWKKITLYRQESPLPGE
jgi:prepilin signal peptidase PulO-like enzyme (type II secretory pathway)